MDHLLFALDLNLERRWSARSDLERVFRLGGRIHSYSELVVRRLRKLLKALPREDARRWLRLLQTHSDPSAFLDLVGHPMFVEDYRTWGLTRKVIEDVAAGTGGSKVAGARARRVLKQEKECPPTLRVPWNKTGHVKVTREELYELVWSTPLAKAAEGFELSDNGLRRICKQLEIPTPPRGYWAGGRRRKPRARLAAPKQGWPTEAWLPRKSLRPPASERPVAAPVEEADRR